MSRALNSNYFTQEITANNFDENSNKTIFDYFNPKSKTGHPDLSPDENRKDKMTDYGDEEDSEKSQASIMQAVFRQIFKN